MCIIYILFTLYTKGKPMFGCNWDVIEHEINNFNYLGMNNEYQQPCNWCNCIAYSSITLRKKTKIFNKRLNVIKNNRNCLINYLNLSYTIYYFKGELQLKDQNNNSNNFMAILWLNQLFSDAIGSECNLDSNS